MYQILFEKPITMLEQRKTINIIIRMLHLGLQICLAYWAVKIDGNSSCDGQNAHYTSYISYVLIFLNLLFAFMINRGADIPNNMVIVLLAINALLVAGVLYLNIDGYNTYNNCAANKLLFQFNFIQTVVAVVCSLFVLFLNLNWAQRYINWPGNIVWPIIFLASKNQSNSSKFSMIIGIAMLLVCLTSFIVNLLVYNSIDFSSKKKKAMNAQWAIAIALHVICQIIAVYNLIKPSQSDGFGGQFMKKAFMVYAFVNVIDIGFWAWGKSKMGIWSSLPDF